jgi:putative flippase GtrA
VGELTGKELFGRFLRFASIGFLCLLFVQLPIMYVLVDEVGIAVLPANAAGFVLSAVVNFYLQGRFTFDSAVKGNVALSLSKFLGTSLLSLGVSSLVMGLVFYNLGAAMPPAVAFVRSAGFGMVDTWVLFAGFIGGVAGAGSNFIASHIFRTFGHAVAGNPEDGITQKAKASVHAAADIFAEAEQIPRLARVKKAVSGRSLAFFMPAYREEENLDRVVGTLIAYLRSLNLLEFKVFIVNDGSPDQTGAVAERLARVFPEVVVIHHEVNRGYGGALITGFDATVATGYDISGFFDGDGQFDPKSIGTLLAALLDQDGEFMADMAAGYRLGRRNADSAFRFWLGRAWHFFGGFVVGKNADGKRLLGVHDVDCGLKLFRTKSLARISKQLGGQAAAISPELIARAVLDSQTIVERGVTHLARQAGTSTGDDPRVMIRSAWNILLLGLRLRREILFGWVNSPIDDVQTTLLAEGWKQ